MVVTDDATMDAEYDRTEGPLPLINKLAGCSGFFGPTLPLVSVTVTNRLIEMLPVEGGKASR